jgi:hypothetical protein
MKRLESMKKFLNYKNPYAWISLLAIIAGIYVIANVLKVPKTELPTSNNNQHGEEANSNEHYPAATESPKITEKANELFDAYYKIMPTEDKINKSIRDYYINSYRSSYMMSSQKPLEGVTEKYNVYYAGDGYMIAKLENEDEVNATFFLLNPNRTIKPIENIPQRIWDEVDNTSKLLFLTSGSFTVHSDVYDNYDGKEEQLNTLVQAIRRYYGFSKVGSNAKKAYLLDFDEKSTEYYILLETTDGYFCYVYIRYDERAHDFDFRNFVDEKCPDVIHYKKGDIGDGALPDFMIFYDYAKKHCIKIIDK